MKKLFTILSFLVVCLFTSSCGGDSVDCTGASFSSALSAEVNALAAAAQVYALDPTNTSNCNAYKDALSNYLDALKPYSDCVNNAQEEAEINAAIEEAKADVDQLTC